MQELCYAFHKQQWWGKTIPQTPNDSILFKGTMQQNKNKYKHLLRTSDLTQHQRQTSPEGKSSFLYVTAHDDISVRDDKPVKVMLNGAQLAQWMRWSNSQKISHKWSLIASVCGSCVIAQRHRIKAVSRQTDKHICVHHHRNQVGTITQPSVLFCLTFSALLNAYVCFCLSFEPSRPPPPPIPTVSASSACAELWSSDEWKMYYSGERKTLRMHTHTHTHDYEMCTHPCLCGLAVYCRLSAEWDKLSGSHFIERVRILVDDCFFSILPIISGTDVSSRHACDRGSLALKLILTLIIILAHLLPADTHVTTTELTNDTERKRGREKERLVRLCLSLALLSETTTLPPGFGLSLHSYFPFLNFILMIS